MKRIIFVMLMLAPAYVHAAEKCIKLDPSGSTTCETFNNGFTGGADWSVLCPPWEDDIIVRGIALCAKTSGTWSNTEVTVVEDLEISSDASENKYCWCKMASPAVSDWVYGSEGKDADYCAMACSYNCQYATALNGAAYELFWKGLFSNLKD